MSYRVIHSGAQSPGPRLLDYYYYRLQLTWTQRIYAITPRRARKGTRRGQQVRPLHIRAFVRDCTEGTWDNFQVVRAAICRIINSVARKSVIAVISGPVLRFNATIKCLTYCEMRVRLLNAQHTAGRVRVLLAGYLKRIPCNVQSACIYALPANFSDSFALKLVCTHGPLVILACVCAPTPAVFLSVGGNKFPVARAAISETSRKRL